MNESNIFLFFIFSITLHNIEEALWLPQWSKHAQRFHKQVAKDEFYFALIVITLLAYLSTLLFILFPTLPAFKCFFFGFAGTMIVNTVFPHFVATVILKKYSPGLITGTFLVIPSNSLIIVNSINSNITNLYEVILSTVVVAVFLLALIPVLFRLGRKLINYESP